MTVTPDFRDALYEQYVSGHQGEVRESGSEASLITDVVSRLPASRASAILDVGCGQGQLVALMAARGYTAVRGIDTSAEQVELAHRRGRTTVEHAELFAFAALHAGQFEAVTAIDVVEHFDRVAVVDLFRALASLLAPGGVLILRTPNAVSPYGGRILYSDLTHGLAYTRRSVEQAAAAVGLDVVGVFPVRPAGNGWRQRVRRALWRCMELGFIAPLVVETGELREHIVTQNLIGVMRSPATGH